jgi:hypothetical protein
MPFQPAFAAEPAAQANPLASLIDVEAESCTDSTGTPISGDRATRSKNVFYGEYSRASGGAVITPVASPYRIFKPFPKPVEASTRVAIPTAGRWYAHVRYAVTPDKIGNMEYRKATATVKHFHMFAPFQVEINGKRFTAGADQSEGDVFRWDKFAVELPAGPVEIKFLMPDMAAPDCIVLTRDAEYSPQVSDYEGPLWLRFRVRKGPPQPFFLRCIQNLNPYESKKPYDAGWLFKGKPISSLEEARRLQSDPAQLLTVGEWSPWVQTVAAKKKYTYEMVAALRGDKTGRANPSLQRLGIPQLELDYQAAARPDENFLLRQGSESTGDSRIACILLPTAANLQALRTGVKSFSEWADERLRLVTDSGLQPGEGPRRIQVLTMNNVLRTPREVDDFLEICARVGFNGVTPPQEAVDEKQLWDRIADKGFTWATAHHLSPVYKLSRWLALPPVTAPGAAQQTIDAFWYGESLKRIHQLWDDSPRKERELLDLANIEDEPGPMPSFVWANCIPAVRASFHDFLRANGQTPASFGKKSWDEVDLIGYQRRKSEGLARLLKQVNIDLEYSDVASPATSDLLHYQKVSAAGDAAPRYRVAVPIIKGLRQADAPEKRQYYWSQRFRSYFTHHFYGQTARAVESLSKQGWLRAGIKTTPNFQAAPMMEARMWDGGLDLFEWARAGATNALMTEDWNNDPYRTGFGLALLNAAARKRGQTLGYLITTDQHYRQRYLMGLGLGAKTFVDYLYGPLGIIGGAWGDNPQSMRERAEMMRATRTVEDDLLATQLRPAQTAILVANSSEINSAFYDACAAETGLTSAAFGARPLFRRAGIYSALLDAGVPTEIVSETGILEDKALNRYKVLYVTDTHVSQTTQEAIREWVRRGGVLWADYTALARDEYDENSDTFNEVFGLAERGPLPQATPPQVRDAERAAVTGEAEPEPQDEKVAGNTNLSKTAEQINVLSDAGLEAVSFPGSLFHPAWKLSTGKALAKFQDGAPALVLNHFGQGQTVLLGCSALALSPYAVFDANETPASQKAQRVTTLGTELAGVATPCRASVARIGSIVRDGNGRTVLILINSTGAAQKGVQVHLALKHTAATAYDSHNRPVAFQQHNGEATFTCDLAADDGEIIVFR